MADATSGRPESTDPTPAWGPTTRVDGVADPGAVASGAVASASGQSAPSGPPATQELRATHETQELRATHETRVREALETQQAQEAREAQPRTDELPLPRRFVRRVKRGDQREAVRDAARTIESRVPADFRVAIATGVLAVAAGIVQQALFPVSSASTTTSLIGYGLAVAFLVFGVLAVRSLASELGRVSTAKGGRTAAQAIRVTTLLIGYVLVVLVTLGLIDVRLGNLLVGGALTGVVLGIAAQQALGNVFAGLVLLFSRPYVPGEQIRVNSGAIGGPHDGVVVSVGLAYTVLMTSYGPLNIPNAQLLASAIGPQPPEEPDPDTLDDDGAAAPPVVGGPAAPRTDP